MIKLKSVLLSLALASAVSANAGGILTNTNQNIAFLRNPARDAAIGIDGVYSNPAGVAFMNDGLHLSINIQNVHQTRTITSTFAPFAYGADNSGNQTKTFKGKADAPVLPSFQAAYNKNDWSFQFNFAVTGGGGKCEFNNGLGSFESSVGLLPLLSQNLDAITSQLGLGTLGLPTVSQYRMDTYMRGRQYYYGFTLGAARKLNKNWSVYVGARLLYGTSNYYGYVSNIQANINGEFVSASSTFKSLATQASTAVGQYTQAATTAQAAGDAAAAAQYAALAQEYTVKATMLTALGSATEDVTLNCDQSGWGVAPILGVDFKTGDFNFAAKYEFKTRMRLKNRSANSESAKNLELLDRYEDGIEVAEDSPALLTLGAQWSILPQLRVSAGWHHYFDKDATQFNDHQKKLDGNTNEFLFGAEYDINKTVQVSAGLQKTNYSFTDDYMEDISFNVSSYSFGFGVGINLSKKLKLNLAYFQTNYSTYNRESNDYNNVSNLAGSIVGNVANQLLGSDAAAEAIEKVSTMLTTPDAETGKSILYGSDSFTRTNRVFGIGLDINI
ncbi:MAG: transporter [Prevotellaceae bacterium]|nr:transporter [Prevotellaceae bacterium]